MKISYNWLKEYIKFDIEPTKIAEILTDTGLEVEKIKEFESIKGGLKGVVIGEVLKKEKHPNADRLNTATVNIGSNEPLQIVCGAPNLEAGQKVLLATIGTTIYSNDESFKIKKGKIRGEISEGMICSESELGLGSDSDGIMILDKDAKVGIEAAKYFNIEIDYIFEIGLTPNRSDAMSHHGVARDLAAALKLKDPNISLSIASIEDFQTQNSKSTINIEVEDYNKCPRYAGVTIENIKVASSPDWLKKRIQSIGLTPINNIVDITNYILHDLGQPLHAFDLSKIDGNCIKVKSVSEKTKFITLDGIERVLSKDDLMICNAKESMCIAGVFGGLKSAVTTKTTKIFLESAYFNPVSIRKTAKRHSLNTDASFRFERSVDPNLVIHALKRAAIMIQDITGGVITSEIIDLYPNKIENCEVKLSYDKMDKLIGEKLDRSLVKTILENLEIKILKSSANELHLSIPPYRHDVRRSEDIIEEILRIYGYNSIGIPNKLSSSLSYFKKPDQIKLQNIISDFLSNNGFNEAMNNSITKSSYNSIIDELNEESEVKILNPLSQDLNAMRQSLIFSGLININHNINRKNSDLKLYEFGKTYNKNDQYHESSKLMLLACGRQKKEGWNNKKKQVDLFWLKEHIDQILGRLGLTKTKGQARQTSYLNNSYSYSIKKRQIVLFGSVNNKILKKFEIKSDVYYAEFDWDAILQLLKTDNISYKAISKFPVVRRDLALLVNNSVEFQTLKSLAKQSERKLLKSVNLFDVYEGKNLPKGKKSYALSFMLESTEKTLTDKEIDKIMSKLMKSFQDKVGAEIRM